MRISITDRCNLRCRYCMPAEGVEKISMGQLLTYEEILDICRAAVEVGICRFKITGGEPLVRRGCAELIREIKEIPGVKQVTLTTNGQLLRGYMEELTAAGLDGVNISLDSLQEDRYRDVTRGGELREVLAGIRTAKSAGLNTKLNCILQKGFNEDELPAFARLAFDEGIDVRFIELMPVGFGNADMGISNQEILPKLIRLLPGLTPDTRVHGNGPAEYWHIPGKAGAIGLISAVHGRFCSSCNRIRLTSTGQIKPCLSFEESIDLRQVLRGEQQEGQLQEALRQAILRKPAGHWFEQKEQPGGQQDERPGEGSDEQQSEGHGIAEKKSMAEIGG